MPLERWKLHVFWFYSIRMMIIAQSLITDNILQLIVAPQQALSISHLSLGAQILSSSIREKKTPGHRVLIKSQPFDPIR